MLCLRRLGGLISAGSWLGQGAILLHPGGRFAPARRMSDSLDAFSGIVSFYDVPIARGLMLDCEPEQCFK